MKKKIITIVIFMLIFVYIGINGWNMYIEYKEQENNIVSVFDYELSEKEKDEIKRKHHLTPYG